MNSIEPILAGIDTSHSLPTSWFGLVCMLLIGLGWLASLPLVLVNPVIIAFRDVSASFKMMNFACWGLSLVPLLVGIYYAIATPNAIVGDIWSLILDVYQFAFPFITICQFYFLVSDRKSK